MNTVVKRMKRKTPKFFQKVRNAGLAIGAAGITLLTAPVALPAVVIKIAGYLAVAGAITSAVSQAAVTNEKK
jgi:hypothetical protein